MEELKRFESRVPMLSDSELIDRTQVLFQREKRLGDAILLCLREIKSRRLFAALGYGSLFEFLVKHFGLSESAAYTRLNALKLIESVPEVQEEIFSGRLSLSTAAQAQTFIQRSEKASESKMSIDAKREVVLAVTGQTQRQAQSTLAARNPVAALPADRERPLAVNHLQMQITVDQETLELLRQARELLGHKIPDGSWCAVLKCLAEMTLPKLAKERGRALPRPDSSDSRVESIGAVDASRTMTAVTSQSEAPFPIPDIQNAMRSDTRASKQRVTYRTPPAATKRIIFARSAGQCEFVSREGRRCESRHQLEIDHVKPWSCGGSNDVGNLRHLCRAHNQFRAWTYKNRRHFSVGRDRGHSCGPGGKPRLRPSPYSLKTDFRKE